MSRPKKKSKDVKPPEPQLRVNEDGSYSLKIFYYMANNGDGSASPQFFPNADAAEHYASYDDERFCDDISHTLLSFDKDGFLLNPPMHYKEAEETVECYRKHDKKSG